ncbi:MAG: formyltetrahydrofolate deformylase [Pseudomonadota bacterium]|nr:MAG: formyltetrahydrofolate deformylase [Pseudomonadota bacterium]
MLPPSRSAILLMSCPDQQGLVATLTNFVFHNKGNIIDLEQHVDVAEKLFFMRLEWDLRDFAIPEERLGERIAELAAQFDMQWALHFSDETPRMAVLVSKHSHCLLDVLARVQAGEWRVKLPLIVSNHSDLKPVAERLSIDYHYIPVTPNSKAAQEREVLALLGASNIEFVVLARYMQILSSDFIARYPHRIINIHHSFLPAFPGARPYHSAHERGVKIIGATSHYVTEDLDAGPIIEQDVVRVSHNDAVDDLVRKGRDLEKLVLGRAIWKYLQRKILVCRNRTVVFE